MITGKVWKFGHDINTDLMVPASVLYGTEEEQRRAVFSANRPGWVQEVVPGDIIIGGRNYGLGSSRPAPLSLRNLGITCLVAESVNGLFFRNAVNFGFVALECPGIYESFKEGDMAEVLLEDWMVRNRHTGEVLKVKPVPPFLLTLMQNGGILPYLEKLQLLAPNE